MNFRTLLVAGLFSGVLHAAESTLTFDKDGENLPPSALKPLDVDATEAPTWLVRKDFQAVSKPNVLVKIPGAPPRKPGIALLEGFEGPECLLSVKWKVTGEEDQDTAGFVFNYADKDFFLLEANSTEDHCFLYRVRNGKPKRLADRPVILTPYTWHTLQLFLKGGQYVVVIDGQDLLAGKEKALLKGGRAGLWVGPSARISFDNLSLKAWAAPPSTVSSETFP
jgi:hypothetical protein